MHGANCFYWHPVWLSAYATVNVQKSWFGVTNRVIDCYLDCSLVFTFADVLKTLSLTLAYLYQFGGAVSKAGACLRTQSLVCKILSLHGLEIHDFSLSH